jgi:hypothetical protein
MFRKGPLLRVQTRSHRPGDQAGRPGSGVIEPGAEIGGVVVATPDVPKDN